MTRAYVPAVGQQVLAHGIGGRQDLPLPLPYVIVGAALAVVASFLVLGGVWRTSRLGRGDAGVSLGGTVTALVDARPVRVALRLVGLIVTGYVAVAAIWGRADALNPTAYAIYVLFWVGVPFASLLFGPVWRLLNPLRSLHAALAWTLRLNRRHRQYGLVNLPPWLGYWPAATGLLAFVWLELVAPGGNTVPVLRAWFGVYGAVHLVAALLFGARWFERCEAFETYSNLVGRLSPLGRRNDGRVGVRNPLEGLAGIHPAPGLTALACVLFGSTAYDGGSGAPLWVRISMNAPVLLGTAGLMATIGGVAATYLLAMALAGRMSRPDPRCASLPEALAHSLLPIGVAYVAAHYFSLFVFGGQQAVILLSDPLGTGANLLGTATRGVDYALISGTTIALVQVAAVVVGHIAGTVAAHDRALTLFHGRGAIRSQIPLLVLMVGYTSGGLALLFAG